MVLKRAAALVVGLLLMLTLIKSQNSWLFLSLLLLCLLLAAATIWIIARREGTAFGHWQDYVWVGLIGTTTATLVSSLVSRSPLAFALLTSLARGIEAGAGLGLIAFALHRPPAEQNGVR